MSENTEKFELEQSKLREFNKMLSDNNDRLLQMTKKHKVMVRATLTDRNDDTTPRTFWDEYRISLYSNFVNLEHRLLKSQAEYYDELYSDNEDISEIQPKENVTSTSKQQVNDATNASPTATDSSDKNDMQPLKENVVESDAGEVKDE